MRIHTKDARGNSRDYRRADGVRFVAYGRPSAIPSGPGAGMLRAGTPAGPGPDWRAALVAEQQDSLVPRQQSLREAREELARAGRRGAAVVAATGHPP